jgi:hypothetical protein
MARQGHFMRAEMVESQFESFQLPRVEEKGVLTIDAVIQLRRRRLWLGKPCRSGRLLKILLECEGNSCSPFT